MNYLMPFVLLFFPHVGVKQKVSSSLMFTLYYSAFNFLIVTLLLQVIPEEFYNQPYSSQERIVFFRATS